MGKNRDNFRFEGFSSPNYTPIPDQLFDELLAPGLLSECELRVLLYIMRRTFGFKKDRDTIAISQITDGIVKENGERLDWGAGVSKASAVRGIKGLESKGTTSKERGFEPTTYGLKMREGMSQTDTRGQGTLFNSDTRGANPLFKADTRGPKPLFNRDTRGRNGKETEHDSDDPLSQIETRGGAKVKQGLGSTLDKQERVKQETENDDSNHISPLEKNGGSDGEGDASAIRFSPYIAAVVSDFSDELGDPAHATSNVTQALRLWSTSGLDEQEFSEALFEARKRVRLYQGRQGLGTIDRRMAYFFTTLRSLLPSGR
jgi:hypothetical protein